MSQAVATDTGIQVDFLVDINSQILNDSHIVLTNLTEERNHEATFTYRSRTLTVKAVEPLESNSMYQVTVKGGPHGIKDITGRTMPDNYVFQFETKDVEGIKPPAIMTPAHLSENSGPILFTWGRVEEAEHYELQISKSNTFLNVVWPREESRSFKLELTPSISYEKGNYYARIRSVSPEGLKSSFSEVIQFYYNDEAAYIVDDPVTVIPPTEPVPTPQRVVLQAKSRIVDASPLSVLQDHFQALNEQAVTALSIKGSKPEKDILNMPLTSITINNQQQIVIELSEAVQEETVTKYTAYIIGERN